MCGVPVSKHTPPTRSDLVKNLVKKPTRSDLGKFGYCWIACSHKRFSGSTFTMYFGGRVFKIVVRLSIGQVLESTLIIACILLLFFISINSYGQLLSEDYHKTIKDSRIQNIDQLIQGVKDLPPSSENKALIPLILLRLSVEDQNLVTRDH